jgi:peptidoglycan lytic transglycosylase
MTPHGRQLTAVSSVAVALGLVLGMAAVPAPVASAASTPTASPPPPARTASHAKPPLDRSGRKRFGKASFYAGNFVGRKMADGTIMNPRADNAASKTLPLGTVAKVTNLETGKSAVVTIRDRGPYVDGRIVDLTPATAHKIGLAARQGVTRVVVAPIQIPLANGDIKFGAGASEINGTLAARNWR